MKLGVASDAALGTIAVAFVILKLCDIVTWSWWTVTAPFWMATAAVLGLLLWQILEKLCQIA